MSVLNLAPYSIAPQSDQFRIARQTIFDKHLHVYGFEMLYRPPVNCSVRVSGNMATAHTISTSICDADLNDLNAGSKPLFINMTKSHIMNLHLLNLPPDFAVYEILEDTVIDEALLQRLKMLRGKRYRFALDDFKLNQQNKKLLPFASFVKLDVQALTPSELIDHALYLRKHMPTIKLVAEKIETKEHMKLCEALDFDLYQGYLFDKPQIITGMALVPSRSTIQKALLYLHDPHVSIQDLSTILLEDPHTVFKLLRFCGHTQDVRVVADLFELISQIGTTRLRVILSLFALTCMTEAPNTKVKDALYIAYQCKEVAISKSLDNPGQYFLAGLISQLESFINRPLHKEINVLPINRSIKRALTEKHGQVGCVLNKVLVTGINCQIIVNNAFRSMELAVTSLEDGIDQP